MDNEANFKPIDLSYFSADAIIQAEKKTPKIKNQKSKKIIKSFSTKKNKDFTTKFIMHDYHIHVQHEGTIYKIINFKEIENNCLLFPTPLNDRANEPRHFEMVMDKFHDRLEVINAFWSRYDFTKTPLIKEITEWGVILEE